MSYFCKYCKKECTNKNALAQHEIRCTENKNHIMLCSNVNVDDLSDSDKKLLLHYTYLYPKAYHDFYTIHKDSYAGVPLKKYDIVRLAKIATLKDLIKLDEEIQIKDGTWSCPICGLHIKDMGAHVKSVHLISWDDFVKKYNWKGTKICFSETRRDNLSKNKLNYYNNTEAGIKAKQELSKRYKGNNNPACRDDVKLKISNSRKGQHMSIKNKENISKSTTSGLYSKKAKSYGYTFWSYIDDKEVRFRSKCEYIVYLMFNYYDFSVEHEPYKIEYVDPSVKYLRHYIVDFVVDNRLFEVKPSIVDFSTDIKYTLVQNQLLKANKKLEVITPGNFMDIMKIDSSRAKPLSYFENILIHNIKCGECRLEFPISHSLDFYANSNFVKKIGGLEIINRGRILYENKKNN